MQSSGSSNDLNQVCLKVPDELISLIRMIMRTFYGFELYLCMDMLIIYSCLKEEDLADLLRMDLKVVHQHLFNLKKEKFLNEKQVMETSADGKQSKHSYFYINYKMMVNIIKYKLDKIRIQIELEENQLTTRAQFKCTNCHKTYTDLDTKDIFLTMTCLYCGSEVDEDASSLPTRLSRNLLNKFNTQTTIIFDLLRNVEHVRLADFILRPEPYDMTPILERINSCTSIAVNSNGSAQNGAQAAKSNQSALNKGVHKWSGEKTRQQDLLGQTRISINFDSNSSSNNGKQQARELPSILLFNKTQDEDIDNRDSILLNSVKMAADELTNNNNNNVNSLNKSSTNNTGNNNSTMSTTALGTGGATAATGSISVAAAATATTTNENNLESIIMQKLLKHEKKAATSSSNPTAADSPGSSSSSSNVSSPKPPKKIQSTAAALATITSDLNTRNGLTNGYNNTNSQKSSITITKKRNLDQDMIITSSSSSNSSTGTNGSHLIDKLNNNLNTYVKKRKLNSGDVVDEKYNESSSSSSFASSIVSNHRVNGSTVGAGHHSFKRNQSDGSDRDNEFDDDYLDENSNSNSNNTNILLNELDDYSNDQNDLSNDLDDVIMPRVNVQNKMIPLDKITPKLINLMNEIEKENYINICRELYTVIYEI